MMRRNDNPRRFITVVLLLLTCCSLIVIDAAVADGIISGTVKAKRSKYLRNTLIYIEKVNKKFPAPAKHYVMDQKDLTFIPHVLPILAGGTVDYLNSDDVLHNVFTPDACAGKFNLGTWPKGEVRSYTFKKAPCAAVMLCNVHPEMEAFVVVLQNPFYTTVNKDGSFTIEKVPAGDYTLMLWNPKYKAKPQKITVTEGKTVKVEFKMTR